MLSVNWQHWVSVDIRKCYSITSTEVAKVGILSVVLCPSVHMLWLCIHLLFCSWAILFVLFSAEHAACHISTMVCMSYFYHGMHVIFLPWYACHISTMVCMSYFYHGMHVIFLPWYACHISTMVCMSYFYYGMHVIFLPWYACHISTMVCMSYFYHGMHVIFLPWYACHISTMVCMSYFYHGMHVIFLPWYACHISSMVCMSYFYHGMLVCLFSHLTEVTTRRDPRLQTSLVSKVPLFILQLEYWQWWGYSTCLGMSVLDMSVHCK